MTAGDLVAYSVFDLGESLEYNYQQVSSISRTSMFIIVGLATYAVAQGAAAVMVLVAVWWQQRRSHRAAGGVLASLREQLNQLALGLDLSRLDMVAVIGSDSATGGDAEIADQRLYEAALVTAWREVDALESLPARYQRTPEWEERVNQIQRLVDYLKLRDQTTVDRAEQLLRSATETRYLGSK